MAVRSNRRMRVSSLLLALAFSGTTEPGAWAFVTPVQRASVGTGLQKESSPVSLAMASKRTKTLVRPEDDSLANHDDYDDDDDDESDVAMGVVSLVNENKNENKNKNERQTNDDVGVMVAATTTTILGLAALSEAANAMQGISMPKELTQSFDPNSFVPVCAASDGFYRFLQSTAQTVVGKENFIEYGPLIASGLLRVRLELCVVESFFNEAVGPFIAQNGLSWVLPLHETVETFLAGTVFALATTFILVGSTKLLTVIFTYADFFVGGPLRLFGGFFFDRARGKPVILDVGLGPFKTRVIGPKDVEGDDANNKKSNSRFDYAVDFGSVGGKELPVVFASGGVKFVGQTIGLFREVLDAIDLFVGKSLILWVTAYVGLKFVHFKVFPDFP